jgi:spore photoproduct lyase
MGSFATKYVNKEFLKFNPQGKIRIRFSLMPEHLRQILEPNTSTIPERIKAVKKFQDAGYDVHLNFSPVIVEKDWLFYYGFLFKEIAIAAKDIFKWNEGVKAEVIFLTHNAKKHEYNLEHKIPGEDLIWKPEIQETKISQYGGENIRYVSSDKSRYIEEFRKLHADIIPWNTIRYIF